MEVPIGTTLCFLFLFFTPSFADPKCSICRGAGGPFVQGNVYKYNLEGLTVTNIPGSPDDVSSLKVCATAEVFAESSCQYVLKLSNVEVTGADGKKYNGLNEECAKPVKFSYNDGKLEGICGEADDKGAGLNIKRAVISLLSSTKKQDTGVETSYENDVFGICPTEFSFSKDGSKLTIQKTRNLNRCALREEFNLPFPTIPYQASYSSFGAFETSPLFGGELKVTQVIENGALQQASGEEHYKYTPLHPESRVTVKVTYKLTLQSSAPGSIPANVDSPKSIYYEVPPPDKGLNNHDKILEALQKATAAIDPEVKPEATTEFSHLVYVIGQGSKADILQVYNAAQGKTAKNLFLDGLLSAGSADSVEAAAELLKLEQIPKEHAIRWYLDLNFVKHTSKSSLTSLLPLLSGNDVPHQAYLGIGSLAGKFCLEHHESCHTSPEYKELLFKLAAPLDGGCKVDSHEKENNVIASLKGLRNTHHLPVEVAQKISHCAIDKTAKTRVRVAAIEAFSADASKPELEQTATIILKDVEEDSELRIKAYLALVEHPCPKTADLIKELIDNEPINQVGTFIVSHLRNLRASVSPEKEAAKKLFGNIISKKKYPLDQRKFSRNYEVSYSLDALNLGAVGEVNRIFSQKSFIPRSVSMNLTTQLFGHSVNLAEVDIRAENLERILEKYFGPKGVFKTKGAKFLDDVTDHAEEALKKAKEQAEAARPKRSITKQQTEEVASKIKLGPDYDDLHTDLDFSLKVFGSDIVWFNYHHDHLDYKGLKKKFDEKLDESLDKSKTIDIDYKKARRYLDVGVSYPTGLGLPLKIKVIGSSAVNMKVKGQIDFKAIINNPKNAHVAFQVVPSASLELTSLFLVDADVVESGLKVTGHLHSSTGTDFTVKVLDGYGIDVKLGLPVKKQEIINFHSDVVTTVREKHSVPVNLPIKFNVKRQEHGGCFDQLSPLLGLTICGEVSTPMDGYKFVSPAYGPSKATLRLEKDDESLTAYHFKAFYNNKEPDQVSLEVLLDTPNSKTNRKFSLLVQGSKKPQKQLLVTLVSPFKQASFEGLVVDTETEQAVSAKLLSDGAEYFFKAGAHVSQEGNRKKYEPLLEYKYPESTKSDRSWIGRKGASKGGKQPQSTVGITGAVYVEKNPDTKFRKYELKAVTLTTPRIKLTVDGTITTDDNLLSTDLKASYDKETFTLSTTIQKLDAHKYIAKVEFLPSQYPDIGGSIKWEYEKTPHQVENKLVIIHGHDLKSESSRISITQLLKYKYESVKVFEFYTENTVTYPLLSISGTVKGGATPKSLEYDIDLAYDKTQIASKLDAKVGAKHPSDYSIDFEGKALGNSVCVVSKHERVSNTKSKFTNSVELKPGGKYSLNGVVESGSKQGEILKSLTADLKMPHEPKNVKVKAEIKQNSKEDELEFEVVAGNKHVIDIEYELTKIPEPKGSFKVLLQKLVDGQGSFHTAGGKSTGSFHVNILKTGRKIEGSGEVTKTGNHFKGVGDLLFDAKKDPNKKIHIETDTELSEKAIDSKNSLQIVNYKSEVNVKGSLDGTLTDGTLVGEADVCLPSGRVVAFKVNRVLHVTPEDKNVEGTWELLDYESKGAQPRKWALKLAGKNINPTKAQFDGQADFTYVSPKKGNFVVHVAGKKIPKGDKWAISGEGSLSGTILGHPLSTKLDAEVSDQFLKGQLTSDKKLPPAHYEFELKSGDDIAVRSSGKINLDQFNNEIELKLPDVLKGNLPEQPITSLKWQTTNTINIFSPEDSQFKVLSSNAFHWNVDKFVKVSVDVYQQKFENHGKLSWESHVLSPRTLKYKLYNDEATEKGELDLDLQWEGKTADLNVKVDGYSGNPIKVKLSSNVPDHGKYTVDIYSKVAEDGKSGETAVSGTANNEPFTYSGKYSLSDSSPYVDINLDTPQGKSKVFGKMVKKGENHALIESKINLKGLNLDMNGEVNVNSLKDLYVKLYVDSPELKINKLEFEAKTERTKSTGNRITFHGKHAEKELSGNLVLASKGVSPNIHYEGNGFIKVGEEKRPIDLTLKITSSNLPKGSHHDIYSDLKIGKHSANVKMILHEDEKVLKFERSDKYCYEAECKNDEYHITYEKKGPLDLDYDIKVDISLGLSPAQFAVLSHPLIIKGHYLKDGWKFDENTELEYGPKKIQYKEYLNEEHTGFELTLPKRIIAADIVYHVKDKNPVSLKVDANFWLDKKNSPDKKTSLTLNSEANKLPHGSALSSEARFNTPGLKELSVSGNVNINTKDHVINSKFEADVFAKKTQKLVAEYKAVGKKEKEGYTATESFHIYSKGLDIEAQVESKLALVQKSSFGYSITGFYLDSNKAKREGVAKVNFDQKSFSALVKIPECTLYSADFAIDKGNKEFHVKGTVEFLGLKFEEVFEVKDKQAKFTAIQKKDGNPQLDWTIGLVSGQVAEISAKFNKKPLLSFEVALDEAHFLKSKHSYNTDAAKDLLKLYKENSIAITKEASRVIKESGAKIANEITDKLEDARKAMVNFKPAVQHFQKELEELKEEISSNKAVQDAIDFFNKTFGTILKQIGVILEQITDTSERLTAIFNDALKKVTESVKAVIPKLKRQYEDAFGVVLEQVEAVLDFVTHLISDVLDRIKEHEHDIQELTSVVTDFIHEIGQTFAKTFGEIQKEVKDFLNVFWEQIHTLFDQSMIKQKLEELKNYKIPDQYWESYHELVETVEQMLPTPELQHLLKYTAEILEKVLKNQPINKPEVLEHLYQELIAAIRSVLSIIEAHKPENNANIPTDVTLPVPSFALLVAPPGTFRFSLFNWVRSSDLPTLSELFHTYRPTHSPLDIIPPFKASALLLGGTEFFTFDKKHYSFKGSCSYILTKDVIDGNFTVVANMEAGKLKSIALLDHENSIELQHDNKVLLNGQPSDLPAHAGDLHMWRRYNDGTGFATVSGLLAFCTPHLKSCAFSINGFYFGKTRGLFGTYNNEPYDDIIVPDGKVAHSTSEFANAWKISPQCPDGAVHDQPAPPAEECTKLFSGDSTLRGCFPFQNPDNFREACNKQVAEASAEEKQEKACNIALSYTGYCYYVHLTKISIPNYCGKCHVGSQGLQIGESTSVKTPQKEADIVFVVEQLEENEDVFKNLVSPLVSTLTNDLKEHGITDVKFGLIGYGAPEQHWPSIYTFNGEYNGFAGSAKNIHFSKEHNITEPKLSDRIKELQKQLQIEIGIHKDAKAFKDAVEYPYRPEAAKAIVAVLASDCDKAVLPFQSIRALLHRLHLLDSGIVFNLVSPLKDLELEGKDEKTAANVVGFDSYTVYTQGEAKRKVLKGDDEAYKHLKYKGDICTELALGTHGAVFSSSNFINGKPNLRKNFLQVLSNKITESITTDEAKQECKCELDRGMLVKTKCKVVSRKEKEALTVKGGVKGGVKA